MKRINKFSVITACFNSEKYIEETIQSIIQQKAVSQKRVQLEYILCDGGSTDNTLSIIRKYADEHNLIVISERDSGMYDALTKGIEKITGDVCSYLNAGDLYSNTAFDVVLDIMENNPVSWLTGINTFYNEQSQIIAFEIPFKYRTSFIKSGIYGTVLPFIQQESTFWRSELNSTVDLERLRTFKLAGDYYLWSCFTNQSQLYIVQSHLGGFKTHHGQLSGNIKSYIKEMNAIASPNFFLKICAYIDSIVWRLPARVKKALNKKGFFKYDNVLGVWK
ncbi:MAG: glycosyltransferase [Saprospiraceae bacterium]|nr:glycosyltransferase [Saprospiraceae bacterium]